MGHNYMDHNYLPDEPAQVHREELRLTAEQVDHDVALRVLRSHDLDIFSTLSAYADGERRGLDRIGG